MARTAGQSSGDIASIRYSFRIVIVLVALWLPVRVLGRPSPALLIDDDLERLLLVSVLPFVQGSDDAGLEGGATSTRTTLDEHHDDEHNRRSCPHEARDGGRVHVIDPLGSIERHRRRPLILL